MRNRLCFIQKSKNFSVVISDFMVLKNCCVGKEIDFVYMVPQERLENTGGNLKEN